jgi:hypothetical protein
MKHKNIRDSTILRNVVDARERNMRTSLMTRTTTPMQSSRIHVL